MPPRRGTGTFLIAAMAASGLLLGCQPNQSTQPTQAKQDIPNGPICDIIPRKPVAQLFSSAEMHALSKENHLTRQRFTHYGCTLSAEKLERPRDKALFVTLRLDDDNQQSAAPNGVEVTTLLGEGSVAPRRAYIYPTCNGRDYFLGVHATEEVGKGNRAAIKAIALAVVDALDKAQNCREPTTTPSTSPSTPPAG